ncbi:DNA end-binding protein Ku [Branchiibius hedensis]|uniref:Non-homologous end joining protein Ku n=1 Tax=Branchiibius hedensis TaxID=672460 RepID=A0A2Y9BSS2_9MICO|nr:Ku protein [Branchiibius hedensis]PWJ23994.1 DNA end-binding protein Ku [Branchiibius hedensis]SSA32812.1 DNA end-binding protein Ku [Branchiibius hedensis]
MRAIWKGAVSFGLVNVPVRLYSATENHDVQFRQVHREDGGRIRYRRVCAIDGEEVSYDDIAKGYETEDGQMVVLTDDDLANLPISTSKEIAVDKFVPASEIDPLYLDKSYYLEPDASAVKPYALLRDALLQTERVALVTITIRTRMTIAVLRVRDDVIALQTMLWPDEVRAPEFGVLDDADLSVKPAETAMAQMLVESLSGDYDPEQYTDDYEQAVHEVVEAKLAGGEVKAAPEPQDEGGQVVDLLAALQQSVDRAKAARGEQSSARKAPAAKAAVKKAPAKKAAAKKAPARRATAKKAPAKKKSA